MPGTVAGVAEQDKNICWCVVVHHNVEVNVLE
jgi:hypothetical protein